MKTARIGLIGYKFMGKAHSHAYKDVRMFFNPSITPVMECICGRDLEGVKNACKLFGWESYDTDWRDLIARKDIDVIDISSPGDVHKEQAIAAAKGSARAKKKLAKAAAKKPAKKVAKKARK